MSSCSRNNCYFKRTQMCSLKHLQEGQDGLLGWSPLFCPIREPVSTTTRSSQPDTTSTAVRHPKEPTKISIMILRVLIRMWRVRLEFLVFRVPLRICCALLLFLGLVEGWEHLRVSSLFSRPQRKEEASSRITYLEARSTATPKAGRLFKMEREAQAAEGLDQCVHLKEGVSRMRLQALSSEALKTLVTID